LLLEIRAHAAPAESCRAGAGDKLSTVNVPLRAPIMGTIIVSFLLTMDIEGTAAGSWRCRAKPIAACAKHHGRLSSQNGIALKIWLIGTNRIVAVDNDFDEDLPPVMQKYLDMTSPDHSYVYGDFEICPLEPDIPGHMRRVCVSDAENLVVENLMNKRQPFRLVSTWHSAIREKRSVK
jgi:hypothetical protein